MPSTILTARPCQCQAVGTCCWSRCPLRGTKRWSSVSGRRWRALQYPPVRGEHGSRPWATRVALRRATAARHEGSSLCMCLKKVQSVTIGVKMRSKVSTHSWLRRSTMSLTVNTEPNGNEPSCRNPWRRCCHCAKAVRPIACNIVGSLSIEDERVSSMKDEVGLPCPLCMSLSSNLLCPRKRHSPLGVFSYVIAIRQSFSNAFWRVFV